MMTRLVIGHGNVYAPNRNVRALVDVIRDSGAASFGLNEANHVLSDARRRLDDTHRVTVATPRGKSRATPILTSRDFPQTAGGALKVSAGVPNDKWAPVRYITWSGYRHPIGKVAHINVHLHAQVNATVPDDHPRVRQYTYALRALDHLIGLLQDSDHLVVVSGDVNLTRAHERRVPRDRQVRAMLAHHDLTVTGRGVDVIAVPTSCRLRTRVIPGDRVGSDHPFLIGTVTRRRRIDQENT